MSIGQKIKNLASQKNITLAELAKRLGKTKQAVYEMVEKEDVNTSILRQCIEIFRVPSSYFFDDGNNSQEKTTQESSNDIEYYKNEVARLQSLLTKKKTTKIVVELELNEDEFAALGVKKKVEQMLDI